MFRIWPVAMLALALGACSSVTEGTSQVLSFESEPAGAECELERAGIKIGKVITPGSLTVQKARHDISLTCRKDGYQDAVVAVPYDMAASTLGNVLLGGGIGLIIDAASGASIKYAPLTSVVLVPGAGGPATASLAPQAQPVTSPTTPALPAASQAAPARKELSGSEAETLVRKHFEKNREAYGSYIESRHFSSINLRRVTLQRALPGETPELELLIMELEGDRLPVTVTGHPIGFRRVFHYVVERAGDEPRVKDWQIGSSTALANTGQATPQHGIDAQAVHGLVQRHFDSNRTAYARYIETSNPDTLRARSIMLVHQAPGPDPESWDLLVRIDGDRTMDVGRGGFGFSRNFQYRALKRGNSLHLAEWRLGE